MEFEGIVIRRTSYKEGAAVITVLAKDRIRSFLAKGVEKITSKNAPSVNLFARSRFNVFNGVDGEWLRQGEIIESFPNINKDLEKLAILDFISEITNNLVGTNDANDIYDLLVKTLESINNGFSPWTAALIYYAHTLKIAGYGLNVDCCSKCGNKEEIVSLSYKDGGFICSKCFDHNNIKTPVRKLKIYRFIFKVDVANFERVEFEKEECLEIIQELSVFLDSVSQIQFKSLTLLTKI